MSENDSGLHPDFKAEQLAELAATRPDLRSEILVHPNIYPALALWIKYQTSRDSTRENQKNSAERPRVATRTYSSAVRSTLTGPAGSAPADYGPIPSIPTISISPTQIATSPRKPTIATLDKQPLRRDRNQREKYGLKPPTDGALGNNTFT